MRWLLVLVLCAVAADARADCSTQKKLAIARGPIVVDAELDDPTWQTACFIEDFAQQQPKFGAKPTQRIRAAVAIDGNTLYVGARMWARSRADIDDALTQRDDTQQAERFIVSIDPSHTRRLAFSFAVTAAGVRADWIHTDDDEGARDASWNPVWIAKSKLLADGWSTEMAIPLSQLRLPREPATSWGINFDWYIPSRNEDVFWRPVPPDRTAWSSWFGELTDLPPVRPGLALELVPYASTQLAIDEAPTGAFGHTFASRFQAGLDAKLRPLPGLTIAATINPDFGQVEADPAFVNLTAYEVQLPEKRPFFIENNSLFADGFGEYFYSRRIGGLPRFLPAADELALPPQVHILGAVAAGGYVASETQIAALAAVTDQATADAVVAGQRKQLVVAPLTAWGAARVEQQVGASVFGATTTVVQRDLPTELRDLLVSTAIAAAADAKLRTHDGTYELDVYGGLTDLTGTAAAIRTVEESSTHYFQRPDQSYMHVDDGATHLLGGNAGIIGQKRAGMWQASVSSDLQTPGLDLNDMGAIQSADDIIVNADVRRAVTVPTEHLFMWDAGAGVAAAWNFGGLRKPTDLQLSADATLPSFYTGSIYADLTLPGGSDDLTRGGPIMQLGWAGELHLSASTPHGRAQQLSATIDLQRSPEMQQGVTVSANLASRLAPSLRLDVIPSLAIVENHRQYVETVVEPDTTRYLFGHLHRREVSLQLRATWSLSPDLVLTLYAQPFASVGKYDELGERSGTTVRWYDATRHAGANRAILDGVTGFEIAEPDYSVVSLRSTAVLRWEPSPGSTVYLVWQQSRGGVTEALARPLHATLPDIVTQAAIHTIALKLSLWFG